MKIDEKYPTETYYAQKQIEKRIFRILDEYNNLYEDNDDRKIEFFLDSHKSYLIDHLTLEKSSFALESSRAWILFWILHSLEILGIDFDLEDFGFTMKSMVDMMIQLKDDDSGAFSGDFGHIPHVLSTYALMHSIAILGHEAAYSIIDRNKMYRFLLEMKTEGGGFRVHEDGEVDVRAVYCVLSVARLLNLLTPELTDGVSNFIIACQTHEGGFSGYPGNEAHGGYSFCAVASLAILNKVNQLDSCKFLKWLVGKQMSLEGGFQGRTNKLVDACYSYWLIASILICQHHLNVDEKMEIYNHKKLQEYILICSQLSEGGFRDKPGRERDLYHTCYALSGLSLSLNVPKCTNIPLEKIDPIHNISPEKVLRIMKYFI